MIIAMIIIIVKMVILMIMMKNYQKTYKYYDFRKNVPILGAFTWWKRANKN